MNTQPQTPRDNAIGVARKALESQGGRPSRASLEGLVDALLAGEAPKTYGERWVQMALQHSGLLPKQGETS